LLYDGSFPPQFSLPITEGWKKLGRYHTILYGYGHAHQLAHVYMTFDPRSSLPPASH
jgi:hypothetical protein